ncbi:hypothetical protein BH23PSE2_BH23PSE2_02910 [soil metagenome]
MKRVLFGAIALLCLLVLPAHGQQARPYTEGPVVQVTDVKIMDGQFNNYMQYLQTRYKPVMEAQKKAGIILDYAIYNRQARSPEDGDMYLTVVYPSMAAFDGLEDRTETVAREVSGQNRAQSDKAFADRSTMRKILGSELIRRLEVK